MYTYFRGDYKTVHHKAILLKAILQQVYFPTIAETKSPTTSSNIETAQRNKK